MGRKKIYVDMDGVLACWKDVPLEEVMKRGYFLSLYADLPIVSAVRTVLDERGDIEVLSSAFSVRACWEKRTWLDRVGLEIIKAVFIPYGEKKADYVKESDALLIDDFGKNLVEWKGIPVKFYNGINGHGGTEYKYRLYHDQTPETLTEQIIKFAA